MELSTDCILLGSSSLFACVMSVHISGVEGGRGSDKEGVKDGGRLELKVGLLLLHVVFGHVSDCYVLPLVKGKKGGWLLSLYRMGEEGKVNFYPGYLDSKSTHLGSSPDGEVFQSTSKGSLTAQDYRGVSQCEVGRLADDHW